MKDILWRSAPPTDNQFNGCQVILKKVAEFSEGDDVNPRPWENPEIEYHLATIEGNNFVYFHENVKYEVSPSVSKYTSKLQYIGKTEWFVLLTPYFLEEDGLTTTTWFWACLEPR